MLDRQPDTPAQVFIVDASRRAWRPACRYPEQEYISSMAVNSPDLKAFLLSMLVERRFDVGATVVTEGEPGRSMFIVHSGQLVVCKQADSRRAIRIAGLGPGDFSAK